MSNNIPGDQRVIPPEKKELYNSLNTRITWQEHNHIVLGDVKYYSGNQQLGRSTITTNVQNADTPLRIPSYEPRIHIPNEHPELDLILFTHSLHESGKHFKTHYDFTLSDKKLWIPNDTAIQPYLGDRNTLTQQTAQDDLNTLAKLVSKEYQMYL